MISALVRLLRPHQWLKNGFVLIGLLFAEAWNNPVTLGHAAAAFVAFCLLASSVYVFNDLHDREADRLHPVKCRRPLASGAISVPAALALAFCCLVVGFWLAVSYSQAPWVFFAYIVINIAYTIWLKHVVILDVFLISSGFMLRLLAGTTGIGISPSHWLLLCGLMLTLFLGFAKRHAELAALPDGEVGHRRVLEHYSIPLLEQYITIAAACTVLSYSLYTVSSETILEHGNNHLIMTVPFVLYGLLRYLFQLQARGGGGDAARDLLGDPHLMLAVIGWVITVWAVLSGRL